MGTHHPHGCHQQLHWLMGFCCADTRTGKQFFRNSFVLNHFPKGTDTPFFQMVYPGSTSGVLFPLQCVSCFSEELPLSVKIIAQDRERSGGQTDIHYPLTETRAMSARDVGPFDRAQTAPWSSITSSMTRYGFIAPRHPAFEPLARRVMPA